ncbi:GatB/YqeY domain-containing protein [Saccharothrix isguenensis]
MRANLRGDLKAALKCRDAIAVAALRSALAAIENAEAVPAGHQSDAVEGSEHFAGAASGLGAAEAERRHLTEADLRSIVENEIRERGVAADEYDRLGRTDLAVRLRAEAEVLSRYLSL